MYVSADAVWLLRLLYVLKISKEFIFNHKTNNDSYINNNNNDCMEWWLTECIND